MQTCFHYTTPRPLYNCDYGGRPLYDESPRTNQCPRVPMKQSVNDDAMYNYRSSPRSRGRVQFALLFFLSPFGVPNQQAIYLALCLPIG